MQVVEALCDRLDNFLQNQVQILNLCDLAIEIQSGTQLLISEFSFLKETGGLAFELFSVCLQSADRTIGRSSNPIHFRLQEVQRSEEQDAQNQDRPQIEQ